MMKKLLVALLVSFGLQTQAQFTHQWCDSLSYSIVIDSTSWNTLTVTGNAPGIINMVDSIDWYFSACTNGVCYTAQGNDPYYFPFITPQDTVKFCYDAFVHSPFTNSFTCMECDSLIYDFMTDTWVLLSISNPTSINEITFTSTDNFDSRMYDVLGREFQSFNSIPVGTIYIQNRKKHLKIANDGFRTLK